MRPIKLVDGDQHIVEPPDLWRSRLPRKYHDRAPHHEHFPYGDGWVMEGATGPISFGHNVMGGTPGGLTPEKRIEWVRWEQVPRGCYDPGERLKAMDEDGVGATVLYPSPRIAMGVGWNNQDPDFHLACVRIYNDWLSDFCRHAPERLGGMAHMPTLGAEAAREELRRAAKLPGMRGILLTRWPSGGLEIGRQDEAFFAECQERDWPVNIHVSLITAPPGGKAKGATGDMRHLDTPLRAKQLINTGLFDRYPRLKVVFAEVDCGWVPYVKEQMDDRYKRLGASDRPPTKNPPSYYFDRNLFFVFVTDSYGIETRKRVGVSQMLWSSDYPHTGTDWPRSWKTIEAHFKDVPEKEAHAILGGNGARVYGFANGY